MSLKPLRDSSWLLFRRFSWISRFAEDFMDFSGRRFRTKCSECKQGPAPNETFTRSQLAAIASIFKDFLDFHEIV